MSWLTDRQRHGGIDRIEVPGAGALWLCGKHLIAPDPEATLTSVGAGAIGVSVLLLLYPLLPLPRIVAADIAYAVPLTLVAGLGHASLGSVDWPLLGLLLTGSLPGIWIGTRLMRHTPERLVRSLLSLLLAYAGTKLIAF